jgi:hypothetical protein
MEEKNKIAEALKLIFEGINRLKGAFPQKEFTIDGRLVGDIGEVVAALEYDVELFDVLHRGHDGKTSGGRFVQVKATFKDSLTFRTVPDYYLGLKLYRDGTHEEIYNGPGKLIFEKYKYRSGIGKDLLSFPNTDLRELSARVLESDCIPKRKGQQVNQGDGR